MCVYGSTRQRWSLGHLLETFELEFGKSRLVGGAAGEGRCQALGPCEDQPIEPAGMSFSERLGATAGFFFFFHQEDANKLDFRKITWAAMEQEVQRTHSGASLAQVIGITSSWFFLRLPLVPLGPILKLAGKTLVDGSQVL